MIKYRYLSAVVLAAMFVFQTPAVFAGEMTPRLEAVLLQSPPDSLVTVLVRPSIEVEITPLEADIIRRRPSRAESHSRVVRALKQKSAAAQAGVTGYLGGRKPSRGVASWRSYWIANIVSVTATPEEIRRLAARDDVAEVLDDRRLYLQAVDKAKAGGASALSSSGAPSLAATGYVNWALGRLGVTDLWSAGFRGRGILVGLIDSGVDGNHPALAASWRGANGATSTESWFDPWKAGHFPLDDDNALGPTHGTLVTGCMVGVAGADTIGPAPEAQWIAANGFEKDNNGQMSTTPTIILQCFEWIADPDGNPETVDDVPHVLNLSWANPSSQGCLDIYWEPIYNLIAMGVTPIIATGNVVAGSPRVGSPANNPDFFAVGSVDSLNQQSWFSVVGPSICDNTVIKPDVVSFGEQYMSTRGSNAGGGYGYVNGTSFATPLVAGVAALLKQYNPGLLPAEITGAIRSSATDLGAAGADTVFGWGLVDAAAARQLLPAPSGPFLTIDKLTVDSGQDDLVSPGEQIEIVVSVTNNGSPVTGLQGALFSTTEHLSVGGAAGQFGTVATGQSAANSSPFTVDVSLQAPQQVLLNMGVSFSSAGFTDTLTFALLIGGEPEPPVRSFAYHDVGKAGLALTNYGIIGEGDQGGVAGFRYPADDPFPVDHLWHGSLLVGTEPNRISDDSYVETAYDPHPTGINDDFNVLMGGNLKKVSPGIYADQEMTGSYADSLADLPLGVTVSQKSYAWSDDDNDDFVIVEYHLSVQTGNIIEELFCGQHLDWDVGGRSDDDVAGCETARRLAYMFDSGSGYYVGHTLLTQEISGFRALNFERDIRNGFTGPEKFSAMVGGARDTVLLEPDDWSEMLTAGPLYLHPGERTVVAFAVLGGASLEELRENADMAHEKFMLLAGQKGYDLSAPEIAPRAVDLREAGPEGYLVSAGLSDPDGGVAAARVYWRRSGATAWSGVTAAVSGEGDSLSAIVPLQTPGTEIQYYIRAIDFQGNHGFAPADAPAGFLSFRAVENGDGNLDGHVDIFDLLELLRIMSGKITPTDAQRAALDLDTNGKINIFDLIELLRLLAPRSL